MFRTGTCSLCGGSLEAAGGREVGGARLCVACDLGKVAPGLAARGLRVQCRTVVTHRVGEHGGATTRKVSGALPYELALTASFEREGLLSRVGKLFEKELQVGERTFDDAVYVRTDGPGSLAPALADEALRAALLHAMEETGGWVVVQGNRVSLEAVTVEVEKVPAALRGLALVLHHLERHALDLGLPRRPVLARYPDLADRLASAEEARASGDDRFWTRALFFQGSTLDDLEPVARLAELGLEVGRPLEVLRLLSCHLGEGGLEPLASMDGLRVLELARVPSARDLAPLEGRTCLEELTVKGCPVSDLTPLTGLDRLRELWLKDTPVSDLRPIVGLRSLRKLDLRGTAVRDLAPLAGLPSLEILWIEGLPIPPDQVAALRRALPSLDFDPY